MRRGLGVCPRVVGATSFLSLSEPLRGTLRVFFGNVFKILLGATATLLFCPIGMSKVSNELCVCSFFVLLRAFLLQGPHACARCYFLRFMGTKVGRA